MGAEGGRNLTTQAGGSLRVICVSPVVSNTGAPKSFVFEKRDASVIMAASARRVTELAFQAAALKRSNRNASRSRSG